LFNEQSHPSSAAIFSFKKFNQQKTNEKFLDVEEKKCLTDQEALGIIIKTCKLSSEDEWQNIDRTTRDKYLRRLKQKGLSVRQISRLTGLTRGVVLKA
jgi:putative transposase